MNYTEKTRTLVIGASMLEESQDEVLQGIGRALDGLSGVKRKITWSSSGFYRTDGDFESDPPTISGKNMTGVLILDSGEAFDPSDLNRCLREMAIELRRCIWSVSVFEEEESDEDADEEGEESRGRYLYLGDLKAL